MNHKFLFNKIYSSLRYRSKCPKLEPSFIITAPAPGGNIVTDPPAPLQWFKSIILFAIDIVQL